MEFLIYVGLFGILLTVLGQIFTSTIDVQTQGESVSYVTMDGQHIMSRLEYDIARATAIVTPSTLGASGSTLQLTIDGATRTYSLSTGDVLLDGVALNGFATTVTSLNFLRVGNVGAGPDTIRTTLTIESEQESVRGPVTQTFTSTYGLR